MHPLTPPVSLVPTHPHNHHLAMAGGRVLTPTLTLNPTHKLSHFRETSGSREGRHCNDYNSSKTSLRQKLVYKEETSVLYTKNPTSCTATSLPRHLTHPDSHRPCPHAMRGCPYTAQL